MGGKFGDWKDLGAKLGVGRIWEPNLGLEGFGSKLGGWKDLGAQLDIKR